MRFTFLVLLYSICLSIPGTVLSQKTKNAYELTLGASFQQQDRRLFDFPNQDEIVENEKSIFDYQFDLFFNKLDIDSSGLRFDYGGGYSLKISKFSRPFDHNYYTGDHTKELRFIKSYYNHEVLLDGVIAYNFNKSNNDHFDFIFPINIRFSFFNSMKNGTHWSESKWDFNFDNIELNGGIKYDLNRFGFSITTRLLNFQRKDPVIFYDILFHESDPEFLRTKFEFKYFFKLNLGVHYRI